MSKKKLKDLIKKLIEEQRRPGIGGQTRAVSGAPVDVPYKVPDKFIDDGPLVNNPWDDDDDTVGPSGPNKPPVKVPGKGGFGVQFTPPAGGVATWYVYGTPQQPTTSMQTYLYLNPLGC